MSLKQWYLYGVISLKTYSSCGHIICAAFSLLPQLSLYWVYVIVMEAHASKDAVSDKIPFICVRSQWPGYVIIY